MKKRVIAMLLAGVMALSLTACGGGDSDKGKKESGKEMKVAMVTDSGDITDQSFNQTTYESGKAWSEDNDVEFTYYKPESDNDEARKASVDQAVADGANVILLPGYLFASAVIEKSEMYPDVKFVALDVGAGDILGSALGDEYDGNEENYDVKEYYHADNVYCATYQEELSKWLKTSAALAGGSEGRRQKEYELLLSCMEQNKAVVSHDVEIPLVNDGVNWKIQMTPEVSQAGFWRCTERTEYGFGKQKLIAQNEKHKKRVPPGAAIMATSRGTLFFCSFILLFLLPVHEWQCPVLPTAFRLPYPAPLT